MNEDILSRKALNDIAVHRKSFQESRDGLHYVIVDDFLSKKAFDHFSSAFPLDPDAVDLKYAGPLQRNKVQAHPANVFGLDDPILKATINGDVLQWIKDVTGVESTYVPDTMPGGGFHEIMPSGLVGMHIDDFWLGHYKDPRIYNLIIYLPTEWDKLWGGTLFLGNRKHWKKKGDHHKDQFIRVDPLPNRALLFETSTASLHGHPDPLTCPPGQSRRSLSLWYYVPKAKQGRPHLPTIFVADPLNLRIKQRVYKIGGNLLRKIGFDINSKV